MPWIIIWKHNDDFPLLEKNNDAFANKFSNKSRAKRSNAEDGKETISSNLQDFASRCSGPGQVVKIPEIECCSISPVNPVAGPIYFASNCSKEIAKVRKKRFFLDALAISMSSVALGMSMYNTAEIATIKESLNDVDRNFEVVKDFMKSSNKKFDTVLNNERLLFLKIQKTKSNLRKYTDSKIDLFEESMKVLLNNMSYNYQNQINELREEIWEICLMNGRLIPDLISKEEIIAILNKIDPNNETVYRQELEAFYLLVQVLPAQQGKHYSGITMVILKIPRILRSPFWRISRATALPHWFKRNLVTKVIVPEFVIGSVETKELYSVPNFCERHFNIMWKCKFPLTKDELQDLKLS